MNALNLTWEPLSEVKIPLPPATNQIHEVTCIKRTCFSLRKSGQIYPTPAISGKIQPNPARSGQLRPNPIIVCFPHATTQIHEVPCIKRRFQRHLFLHLASLRIHPTRDNTNPINWFSLAQRRPSEQLLQPNRLASSQAALLLNHKCSTIRIIAKSPS